MKLIETTAPIDLADLKLFFSDKETFYLVHYEFCAGTLHHWHNILIGQ